MAKSPTNRSTAAARPHAAPARQTQRKHPMSGGKPSGRAGKTTYPDTSSQPLGPWENPAPVARPTSPESLLAHLARYLPRDPERL